MAQKQSGVIRSLTGLSAKVAFCETDTPIDMSFSHESQSQIAIAYIMPWDKLHLIVAGVLGYPTPGGKAAGLMNRTLPHAFPMEGFEHYRAHRIASLRPWIPAGMTDDNGRSQFVNDKNTGMPAFDFFIVTVVYSPQTYGYVDNTHTTHESQRYTDFRVSPGVEFVAVEAELKILSGPHTGDPVPRPGLVGLRIPKMMVEITWHQVPEWCLFDEFKMPTYVLDLLGRTNSEPYRNKAAETWYCGSVRMEPKIAAVSPGKVGAHQGEPATLWDVTYMLDWKAVGHSSSQDVDGVWQIVGYKNTSAHLFETIDYNTRVCVTL